MTNRWTVLLGAALLCVAAGSLSPQSVVQATVAKDFVPDTASATNVAEINIKSLSPTHKVRLNTLGGGPSDVHVTENNVQPGGHSGWHTHPGPSFVVVKTGIAYVYDGDDPTCTPQVIEQGGSFTDLGGGHVHLVVNPGPTVLVLRAFQIVPAGGPRRIGVLNPGFCGELGGTGPP